MSGPMAGYKIIELAGIGPAPFAGMMLADMGADVVLIERPSAGPPDAADPRIAPREEVLSRGRRSICIDLKHPEAAEVVLRLVEQADALIEGYRPGVAERLGIGPGTCLERNPRLVYGRMTGWGQQGPNSRLAGHDINYLALSGVLSLIGRQGERPLAPLNLVGDYGGGGMLLAFGVVCGLLEAASSHQGQVIDAAMLDGAAVLAAAFCGFKQAGLWGERGTNIIDSGAWFYEVYETSDNKYVTFGAVEPQFFRELVQFSGLDAALGTALPSQGDRSSWPAMKERIAAIVKTRTRDEWSSLLEGTDACFSPVLSIEEAWHHPHLAERGVYLDVAGQLQPAPAPRFSRTPGAIRNPPPEPGADADDVLAEWSFTADDIARLRRTAVIR